MLRLMLPAWATVVIAIGGSAIGAFAGVTGSYFGFRGARLNLLHEEREAWRTRLVDGAQAVGDAFGAVGMLTATTSETADADARQDLAGALATLAQALARVMVLYGEESDAGKAAVECTKCDSALAYKILESPVPWDQDVRADVSKKLGAADSAHDDFMRKAHAAVRPQSWGRA